MPEILDVTLARVSKSGSLYGSLLRSYFAPMKFGKLHVALPDGEALEFGQGGGIEANIRIRNDCFFRKCILYGDVGFGEAYVDGDWDTDSITSVISWMILNLECNPSLSGSKRSFGIVNLLQIVNRIAHRFSNNSLRGSSKNISAHYDLSNDFFAIFLDRTMTYSSACFAHPDQDLEEAQFRKYDRLCKKLRLNRNDKVLEIGSGWGAFAIHAALYYGCHVTTTTISKEQYKLATERIHAAGLEDQIDIKLQDYRKLEGEFDKIVSIEMLEAVGHEYLETFFRKCHELLKRNGLLALQVITCPDSRYDALRKGIDWSQKHIFPGSLLLSIGAINRAVNRTGEMFLQHLEEFGLHYAKTLSIWRDNFNRRLAQVRAMGFNETFIRKWNYYLSYCEAAFRMRNISVVQMVYSRPNNV